MPKPTYMQTPAEVNSQRQERKWGLPKLFTFHKTPPLFEGTDVARYGREFADHVKSFLTKGILPGNKTDGLETARRGADKQGEIQATRAFMAMAEVVDRKTYETSGHTDTVEHFTHHEPTYEKYLEKAVLKMLRCEREDQSPALIMGERDLPTYAQEVAEKVGKSEAESRYESGFLILGRMNTSLNDFVDSQRFEGFQDMDTIYGIDQLKPDEIEAVFVPEKNYDETVKRLPRRLRKKVEKVSGKADIYDYIEKSYMEPPGGFPKYGVDIPAWKKPVMERIRASMEKDPQMSTFTLYGARFDTPKEHREKRGNA